MLELIVLSVCLGYTCQIESTGNSYIVWTTKPIKYERVILDGVSSRAPNNDSSVLLVPAKGFTKPVLNTDVSFRLAE